MFDVAKNAYINMQQFRPKQEQPMKKATGLMGSSVKPSSTEQQNSANVRMAKLAQRIRNMAEQGMT